MRTAAPCVEVFKTNVNEPYESYLVLQQLLARFPKRQINFDLEDCDRILRLEGDEIVNETVIGIVNACGYACEVLD